jgi:hypothetical protein
VTAEPGSENGDRRFRFVVLGRFGFGGTSRVNLTEPLDFTDVTTIEGKPGATLGFDLRFEKPVSKYVTVGGLISNYWLRPQRSSNSFVDLRAIDPNEYALDISPFVKPRYPFRAGSREAEFYLFVYVGGSLLMHDYFTDLSLNPITTARGGFNFGVGPGFQVFVARSVALVFEVGYAYSWFKLSDDFVKSSRVGQATPRFGFAFAFAVFLQGLATSGGPVRPALERPTPLPLQTVEPSGSTATRTELRIRSASF